MLQKIEKNCSKCTSFYQILTKTVYERLLKICTWLSVSAYRHSYNIIPIASSMV